MSRIFLCFFFCVFYFTGITQQFDFENYSVREGLAQSQVYDLLQDRNGYIWMGTRGGGLSRFDGQHFEQFTEKDGIASNYIAALYQDSIGQIWIGCTDGLSKYDGRKFEGVLIDSTQTLSVLSIKEINQQLFVGTHNGLYVRSDDGSFEWVEALRNISIRSIFHASDQTTWLATNQGPYFIKNDSIQLLTRKNGIRNRDIMGFAETADGQFYIGLFGNGVVQLDSSRTKVKRYLPNLNSRLIQSFYQDRRKRIWMGSQNSGLNVYHTIDSSFNYLNERDGLAKNDVRAIMEDSWGNIWIGTSGGGVSKYAGQTFEHLDQSNGLNEDYIYSIAADSSNQLWIAAYNKGINIITDSSIIALNARTGFKNVKVKALFKDREDRMWVGTEGNGLALQDTSGFKYFKAREDGLAGNWIRAITQDSSGHIWVGTASSGISELIPIDTSIYEFTIKNYKRAEGLPNLSINDLHIDSLNRIWIATRGSGVACIENGKVIKTIKRALPSTQVRSLVEDQFGYLWVGMADAGVARMSIYQDTLEVIPYDDLTSNNVYLLLLDDEQNLWVGSERGVDKVSFDAERNISTVEHFGQSEGFVGIETCQNAALKDQNGNLWFGTINGLTRYHPKNIRKNPIPPKLLLKDVRLFYESLSKTAYSQWLDNSEKGMLSLPYNENHLEFDFLGINHSNPDKVSYQWQLDGLETDWSPQAKRTTATYPDLSPGRYTFKARAFNEDNVPSYPILSFSFEITPPYWETLWFKSSVVSAGFLIVLGIFWWILSSIRRKARRREEKLQLEKHALELEQRALQLQMNPHFIFHTLNSIQRLIASKEPQTARFYLSKFAQLMRMMLEFSRENWISLEEELALLDNYLQLEQFSQSNAFDYKISLDEEVDPEELAIPPMMIQPFLENAIIHGITPLQQKGFIDVRFSLKKQALNCLIKDNGVGRAAAKRRKSQLSQNHKSTALQVTQERLDMLHEQQKDQTLEIRDLTQEDGSSNGTEVHLKLPFRIQL